MSEQPPIDSNDLVPPENDELDKPSPKPLETPLPEPQTLETPSNPELESAKPAGEPKKRLDPTQLVKGANLYLIAFVAILIAAGAVAFLAFIRSSGEGATIRVSEDDDITQKLIDDIGAGETTVGDITQTLTVEANAIFGGKIIVKDSLDVAGSLNIGGDLNLPGITVSGLSTFDDAEVTNNLNVEGNASVSGTLSVDDGLNVLGGGSFSGSLSAASLSVSNFEILGDIKVSRHIDSGGATPSVASGGSIGSGGTVSISGTDTAGTITVNTGSSAGSGVLATITFKKSFSSTPHVILSPANAAASSLNYYATRSSSSFSLRTSSDPNDSTTFIFDYFALE